MGEFKSAMANDGQRSADRAFRTQFSNMVARLAFGSRSQKVEPLPQPFAAMPEHYVSVRPSWSKHIPERTFPESSPSSDVILTKSDGGSVRLEQLAGDTTLLLVVDRAMSLLPGLGHRILRRAETLGFGVRLICVVDQPQSSLEFAYRDPQHRIRALAGGFQAPFLLSLDTRGHVFDIMSESDAIMHWLWNDPRPHSMRAYGAVSMDDLVV
ncbi:MAG: hypothetical protein WKF81_07075 [Thermomicrobiales bacterium]